MVGAAGSLGLLFRAGQDTPPFLLVLFVGWILLPFIALAWAIVVSKSWLAMTRTALYWVAVAVALGSPAIYGSVVLRSATRPRGFFFVLVPPVSLLLAMSVVLIAAQMARRRSHDGDAA